MFDQFPIREHGHTEQITPRHVSQIILGMRRLAADLGPEAISDFEKWAAQVMENTKPIFDEGGDDNAESMPDP